MIVAKRVDSAQGEPWPPGMEITIDRADDSLLELLWVRAAWSLRVVGEDVPPPAIELPEPLVTAQGLRRDKDEWQRAWPLLWTAAVARSGSSMPPDPARALDAAVVDRLDVDQLVRALRGPTWRARFGDAAFGDAYDAWRERLAFRVPQPSGDSSTRIPEHRTTDALVPAWRRGLRRVITVPCTGVYTRRLGPETLLVTDGSREDPVQYAAALEAFAGEGGRGSHR